LKIKLLTKEQIIISIDRLTRFKEPEDKYFRVFSNIIHSCILEPQYKQADIEKMDYEYVKHLAQYVINKSIETLVKIDISDLNINKSLLNYERQIFNINENAVKLIDNDINYKSFIRLLPCDIPDNLKFLKILAGDIDNEVVYPVQKVLLCEGITEEILLPVFAKLYGFDFTKNGIYIISAGGKNQVVKYFYRFADSLKIPIFVLLDSDANENLLQIKPKLRKNDKIHLVRSGEFEDLLPNSLIVKTLNYTLRNISTVSIDGLKNAKSKVAFLEDFYRHRGMHEFKKAEFAQAVKANISEASDISDEIADIITELKF